MKKLVCEQLFEDTHGHSWYARQNQMLYCKYSRLWLRSLIITSFSERHTWACIWMLRFIYWYAYLMFSKTAGAHTQTHGKSGEWLHLTTVCSPCSVQAVQWSVPGGCLQPNRLYIPSHKHTHTNTQRIVLQYTQGPASILKYNLPNIFTT